MLQVLDGTILEKEQILKAIKASQSAMQSELIELMKNEYQQKILQLTNDITQLERSRAESLSRNNTGHSQAEKRRLEE